MEQVEKTLRRKDAKYKHPELQLPEIPPATAYLWEWFLEIQNGERLTWSEIRSWSEIMNKEIKPDEAKQIRKLSFLQYKANNPQQ